MSRCTGYGYLRSRILAGNEPPWLLVHKRRSYIVKAALATPDWRNKVAIRELEKRAIFLTKATGVAHVVDHEIPLAHPMVCGLTVHNNLKVITHDRNKQKSNNLNLELLDQPEQLRMI